MSKKRMGHGEEEKPKMGDGNSEFFRGYNETKRIPGLGGDSVGKGWNQIYRVEEPGG